MIRSALSVSLLVGCGTNVITLGDMQEVAVVSPTVNRDLDVLFVIDNSPSTADKQAAMLSSFPHMMDQLASLDGGMPNLHIGVATSDLGTSDTHGGIASVIGGSIGGCAANGDNGELQNLGTLVTGKFISDVANGAVRETNYTGSLGDAFTSLAAVGSNGCGFEQTLGAMQRALDPANSANAGFIRPTANLAVVLLSDEDDCTMTDSSLLSPDTTVLGPLQSFRCTRYGVTCDDGGETNDAMTNVGAKSSCHDNKVDPYIAQVDAMAASLKAMKADPSQVMVAAIVGDPEPVEVELQAPAGSTVAIPTLAHSCQYVGTGGEVEVADPAVRINELVGQFGSRGALTSVCSGDLTLPLTNIGLEAKQLMGDPCIPIALAHATHPTCEVIENTSSLPSCASGTSGDCFRIVADPVRCAASPDQLRIEITRTSPGTGGYDHVRCVTAP